MSNVKCHEVSNITKCKMPRNDKFHEMSIVIKCQMSWNVKYHEMLIVDAGSMTSSRNTRRYTLRSVQSSPGRSFFLYILVPLPSLGFGTSYFTLFQGGTQHGLDPRLWRRFETKHHILSQWSMFLRQNITFCHNNHRWWLFLHSSAWPQWQFHGLAFWKRLSVPILSWCSFSL